MAPPLPGTDKMTHLELEAWATDMLLIIKASRRVPNEAMCRNFAGFDCVCIRRKYINPFAGTHRVRCLILLCLSSRWPDATVLPPCTEDFPLVEPADVRVSRCA